MEARDEHQAILEEASASIERLAPAVEAARARVDSQRGRVELLRNMGKERDVLKARAAAGRSEIDALDRQRRGYEGRAAEYHALTERREEILQGFGGLDTARRESERLDDVHRRLLTLQSGKARLEQEVAVQRERLSAYLAQLSSNIENGLEPTASRLPAIDQAIADMESEENALEAYKADYARMVGEAHDLSLTIESLEAANTVLREEMSETRQKFDILQREDAECPVCRQLLRPDDRDHVRAEYERQGKKALNRFRDNAAEQDRLRETHSRLATKVSRLEFELSRDARELTRKRTELERDRRDSITARQQLDLALAESEKECARLENEAFAEAERAELARIDARIAEMDYAPDAHNAARRQARELGPYEELIRKLREAEKRLPEERRDLGEVAAMLERRRAETAEDEERAARLGRDIVALPSMEAELRGMEDSLTAKERELEAARVQQGISTEELARLDRLEAEAKEREKKRDTLVDQKGVYDELAVAFGKNGVQAPDHRGGYPAARRRREPAPVAPDRQPDVDQAAAPAGQARAPDGAAVRGVGHPRRRRDGHSKLRDLQRRRGLPHRFLPAYRPLQAACAPLRSAAADPFHRRGVRLTGRCGTGAPQGGHSVHPGRLSQDHRHHPHRRNQGIVPHPH